MWWASQNTAKSSELIAMFHTNIAVEVEFSSWLEMMSLVAVVRTLNRGQNVSGLKLLSNLLLLYLWVASIVHLLHRLLRSTRSQLAWRTQLKRSEVLRIPFTRHTSHWLVTLMQLLPNGAQLINTTVPVGLSKIPFYAWAFTSLLISQPIYILIAFGSLLDLILVSSDKMISDILSLPPLGKSDHISLLCNLNLRKDTPPKATHLTVRGKTIWCYERANHDVVNQALKEAFTDTWNFVRNAESIDDAWTCWQQVFLSTAKRCIPHKIITKKDGKILI